MSGRVKQETGRLEGTEREREDVKSELWEEFGGGGGSKIHILICIYNFFSFNMS